jgi:hypothetical protein
VIGGAVERVVEGVVGGVIGGVVEVDVEVEVEVVVGGVVGGETLPAVLDSDLARSAVLRGLGLDLLLKCLHMREILESLFDEWFCRDRYLNGELSLIGKAAVEAKRVYSTRVARKAIDFMIY